MATRQLFSRRGARAFSTNVEVDWSRPMWTKTPIIAAQTNKFRAWVSMSEGFYEKYQKPPTPINFQAAKSKIRDQVLLQELESFYKTFQPPAEKHEMPASEVEERKHKMAFILELDALNQELMPVLQKELEFLQTNRTTTETTMFDMQVNYPLIHEEIEDDLERREWFKDTEYDRKSKDSPEDEHHHH